jgi:hypothetical protein
MSKEVRRWAAGSFGFAVAAIGTTVGAQAALICLLGAALCTGILIVRERSLIGRLTTVAGGVQQKLESRAQAPRRTKPAAPPRRPRPQPSRPKQAHVPRPYDRDEPSSEHVYEVATYGW